MENLNDFDRRYVWESLDPFDQTSEYRDRNDILSLEPLTYPDSFNKNICRIYLQDGYVHANHTFNTGDIVEICPCDIISDYAVANSGFKDKVFEVKPNEEYALPHGYCQYYDIADNPEDANCDYIWDPNAKQVVIRALRQCPRHQKLVLNLRQKQQSLADRQFNPRY